MSQDDEPVSDPAATEGHPLPPSVRPGVPLVSSYTSHSVDRERDEKGKGKAADLSGEWILGVDEAGRGPVLGPQVYGIAFCRTTYHDQLKQLGFADSKTLTEERRAELLEVIIQHEDDIHWSTTIMSPHDLSAGMLRKTPYNLNAQSHDATIELIRSIIQKGFDVKEVYVDTVGQAAEYQAKLSKLFPLVSFTVTSKADSIYPIVSAASIAAKVTRDACMRAWTFLEPGLADRPDIDFMGSGYPSDPKTVAWLERNVDPVFGFPQIVRFSWQTVKTLLLKKAYGVTWDDEPKSIQKYFSPEQQEAAARGNAPTLFRDMSLTSVGAF